MFEGEEDRKMGALTSIYSTEPKSSAAGTGSTAKGDVVIIPIDKS